MAAHGLCKLPIYARITQTDCRRGPDPFHSLPVRSLRQRSLHNPWLGISGIAFQSSSVRTHVLKHRPMAATVSSTPPTEVPEKASTPEKIPKWSCAAIRAISLGEVESRKLRYTENLTETILMGILLEATNVASSFLRANEITVFKARDEAIKIKGKAEMFTKRPPSPPLSKDAIKALDWAVAQKLKAGDGGEVTTPYLVLGIWSEVESVGHKILANLGFNDEKAKELESLCPIPE